MTMRTTTQALKAASLALLLALTACQKDEKDPAYNGDNITGAPVPLRATAALLGADATVTRTSLEGDATADSATVAANSETAAITRADAIDNAPKVYIQFTGIDDLPVTLTRVGNDTPTDDEATDYPYKLTPAQDLTDITDADGHPVSTFFTLAPNRDKGGDDVAVTPGETAQFKINEISLSLQTAATTASSTTRAATSDAATTATATHASSTTNSAIDSTIGDAQDQDASSAQAAADAAATAAAFAAADAAALAAAANPNATNAAAAQDVAATRATAVTIPSVPFKASVAYNAPTLIGAGGTAQLPLNYTTCALRLVLKLDTGVKITSVYCPLAMKQNADDDNRVPTDTRTATADPDAPSADAIVNEQTVIFGQLLPDRKLTSGVNYIAVLTTADNRLLRVMWPSHAPADLNATPAAGQMLTITVHVSHVVANIGTGTDDIQISSFVPGNNYGENIVVGSTIVMNGLDDNDPAMDLMYSQTMQKLNLIVMGGGTETMANGLTKDQVVLNNMIEALNSLNYGSSVNLSLMEIKEITDMTSWWTLESTLLSISAPKATFITGSTFQDCSKLTSVNLPEITEIAQSAFDHCTALTSINLPKVTKIPNKTFNGCNSLTSIHLPAATTIAYSAFNGCSSLRFVSLPEATDIGSIALGSCSSLISISLPKATTIEVSAFGKCTSLASIDLPMAKTIGQEAFGVCPLNERIHLPKAEKIGKLAFNNGKFTSITLPAAKELGESVFEHCANLTTVSLPVTKTFGSNLFSENTILTTISIPSVTEIPDNAFNGCTALTTLTLNEGVTSIGKAAFKKTSITDINLSKVKTIGDEAFSGCGALESVNLNSATEIGKKPFSGCDKLTTIELKSATIIPDNMFSGCKSLANFTLSDEITKIGASAFKETLISTINLSQVEEMGNRAFDVCSRLAMAVNIPKVQRIEEYTFYGTPITGIELAAATSIGKGAFGNCSQLATVNLPAAQTIGTNALMGCPAIATLHLPAATDITNHVFKDNLNLKTADVRAMTVFGDDVFNGCTALSNITLSDRITSIGARTFKGVPIQEMVQPVLKTIGDGAFHQCRQLRSISMPLLTAVNDEAFSECPLDKGINLPEVKNIGIRSFYGGKFTTIELRNARETGDYAFQGNENLKKVKFWGGYTFGKDPFEGCPNITDFEAGTWDGDLSCIKPFSKGLKRLIMPHYKDDANWIIQQCTQIEELDLSEVGNNQISTESLKLLKESQTLNTLILGLSEVAPQTFDGARFRKVTLPKATTLGWNAFINCTNLEEVDCPEVLEIDQGAFAWSGGSIKRMNLPKAYKVGHAAFQHTSEHLIINLSGMHYKLSMADSAFTGDQNNPQSGTQTNHPYGTIYLCPEGGIVGLEYDIPRMINWGNMTFYWSKWGSIKNEKPISSLDEAY